MTMKNINDKPGILSRIRHYIALRKSVGVMRDPPQPRLLRVESLEKGEVLSVAGCSGTPPAPSDVASDFVISPRSAIVEYFCVVMIIAAHCVLIFATFHCCNRVQAAQIDRRDLRGGFVNILPFSTPDDLPETTLDGAKLKALQGVFDVLSICKTIDDVREGLSVGLNKRALFENEFVSLYLGLNNPSEGSQDAWKTYRATLDSFSQTLFGMNNTRYALPTRSSFTGMAIERISDCLNVVTLLNSLGYIQATIVKESAFATGRVKEIRIVEYEKSQGYLVLLDETSLSVQFLSRCEYSQVEDDYLFDGVADAPFRSRPASIIDHYLIWSGKTRKEFKEFDEPIPYDDFEPAHIDYKKYLAKQLFSSSEDFPESRASNGGFVRLEATSTPPNGLKESERVRMDAMTKVAEILRNEPTFDAALAAMQGVPQALWGKDAPETFSAVSFRFLQTMESISFICNCGLVNVDCFWSRARSLDELHPSCSLTIPYRVHEICLATFGTREAFVANYYRDDGGLKKVYYGVLSEVAIGEKFYHVSCENVTNNLKKMIKEHDHHDLPLYGWVPTWVVDRRVRWTEDGELLKEETFEEPVDNVGEGFMHRSISDD